MASDTPAHDFLQPALVALLDEATARGISREVAVAVLTDLVTGSEFNHAAPDPMADSGPRPDREPGPSGQARLFRENNLIDQVVEPRGFI